MLDRRRFLTMAGAAAAAAALATPAIKALAAHSGVAPHPKGRPASAAGHAIGLQLFTLFPIMDDDPRGYLKKVAAIGYTEIESAYSKLPGFYGIDRKSVV